jgi:hypothetical protein
LKDFTRSAEGAFCVSRGIEAAGGELEARTQKKKARSASLRGLSLVARLLKRNLFVNVTLQVIRLNGYVAFPPALNRWAFLFRPAQQDMVLATRALSPNAQLASTRAAFFSTLPG